MKKYQMKDAAVTEVNNTTSEIDRYTIGQFITFSEDIELDAGEGNKVMLNKGNTGTVLGALAQSNIKALGSNVTQEVRVLVLSGPLAGTEVATAGVIVGVDYAGITDRIIKETNIKKSWLFSAGKKLLAADIERILRQYA